MAGATHLPIVFIVQERQMQWLYLDLPSSPMRGEWPSGLYSPRQVTEVKLGQVRSNSGWVTSKALPHSSPRYPSERMLNYGFLGLDVPCTLGLN